MAKQKTGAKTGKKIGIGARVTGLFSLIMAVICLPSFIILMFGMLPTIIAAVLDRTKKGMRGLTIGAMNLAGCLPFLIEVWTKGNTFRVGLSIISDPRTVVVIYCAAGIGYLIDWSLTGIVASFVLQSGQKRRKDIQETQSRLILRWGQEVTGEVPVDAYGFPLIDAKDGK